MRKIIFASLFATLLLIMPITFAQTQSHPLSQVTPIDTDLSMNSRNITALNYLLYSGGIFYSGSQGIPSADIASSAVTGAKIASSVVTASKLSNPLGGSVNGSTYYDSDNSAYYLDPASVGTGLNIAGDATIANILTTQAVKGLSGSVETLYLRPGNTGGSIIIDNPSTFSPLFVANISSARVGIAKTNP